MQSYIEEIPKDTHIHTTQLELISEFSKVMEIKSTYENLLDFYTLTMKNLQRELRKQSYLK